MDAALNSEYGLHLPSFAAAWDLEDATIREDLKLFEKQGYKVSFSKSKTWVTYTVWHYDDRDKPDFKPMFADQGRGLDRLEFTYDVMGEYGPPYPLGEDS